MALNRYRTCDVNAYLRAELPKASTLHTPDMRLQTFTNAQYDPIVKVLAGDVYRADCHFLPQAAGILDRHAFWRTRAQTSAISIKPIG